MFSPKRPRNCLKLLMKLEFLQGKKTDGAEFWGKKNFAQCLKTPPKIEFFGFCKEK